MKVWEGGGSWGGGANCGSFHRHRPCCSHYISAVPMRIYPPPPNPVAIRPQPHRVQHGVVWCSHNVSFNVSISWVLQWAVYQVRSLSLQGPMVGLSPQELHPTPGQKKILNISKRTCAYTSYPCFIECIVGIQAWPWRKNYPTVTESRRVTQSDYWPRTQVSQTYLRTAINTWMETV